MLVGEAAEVVEEVPPCRVVATLTLHRLDEETRDLLGAHLMGEHLVELEDGPLGGLLERHLPAERMRIGRHEHRAHQRVVALAVLRLRGRVGDRPHRAAVEAAAEHDDALAAARLAGQLDRRLDGLGARVHEEERVDAVGRHGAEPFSDADEGFVEEDAARMPQAVELVEDRLLDGRRLMSEVRDGDAAGEVEVALAGGVGDPAPFGSDDFDVRVECLGRGDDGVVAGDEV